MPRYVSLVTVENREFQNIQELASIWGEIRGELQEFDVDVIDTYAVLGNWDFVFVFDAPDRETTFKAALTIESYGLDMETMAVESTETFGKLVDDHT